MGHAVFVLAVVPALAAHKLSRAGGEDFQIVHAERWHKALGAIRTRPIDLAVVDPLLSPEAPRSQEILRIRALFPSLPLIVYTALTPDTANLLLAFGRNGIRRVVFTRHDDHATGLREVLEEERRHSVAQQLLSDLERLMEPLPPAVRWALEAALTLPGEVQTVTRLALRAGVDRRTFQRWLGRAGLASPRPVLAATRLLYAHRLLQDPGYTVEDVAQKLGYGQVRTLQIHAREILGLSPGELRLAMAPDDALAMVGARVFGVRARARRQRMVS